MTDDLQELLKKSLDAKPKSKPNKDKQSQRGTKIAQTIAEPPNNDTNRIVTERHKVSISLYSGEIQIAERIMDSVKQTKGKRIGMSEAIRIAVQLCPDDNKRIGQTFDHVRAEDRRRSLEIIK